MRRLRWPADTESQLRLLVRAYPVAWREQRGDELVGTVVELLGPRRLGWALAFNVVIGGWKTRLREHPPFGRWLAYLMLERSLPERWRPWMRRDILSRFFLVRRAAIFVLGVGAVFGVGAAGLAVQGHRVAVPPFSPVGWVVGTAIGFAIAGRRVRRRALHRHGFDDIGELLVAPVWPRYDLETRPRDVHTVWPWLVSGGAVGVLLAIPWQLILARLAPTLGYVPLDYTGTHAMPGYEWKMWAATVASAATSLLVAAVALLRLKRRLATRTGTNRGEVTLAGRWRLGLAVGGGTALWAALAVIRDQSAAREPYTLVLHSAILLTAPAALVTGLIARRCERRGGLTVTLRDIVLGTVGRGAAIPDLPPVLHAVGENPYAVRA